MKFEELYRARTDALDVPELDADELRRKAAENADDAHRAALPAAPKRGFKIKYAAFAATAAVLVLSVSLVIYTMNGRGGGDTPSDILANETASSPAATETPPVTESVPSDPDTSCDTADAPQTGDESQTKAQPDTKDTADTVHPPSPVSPSESDTVTEPVTTADTASSEPPQAESEKTDGTAGSDESSSDPHFDEPPQRLCANLDNLGLTPSPEFDWSKSFGVKPDTDGAPCASPEKSKYDIAKSREASLADADVLVRVTVRDYAYDLYNERLVYTADVDRLLYSDMICSPIKIILFEKKSNGRPNYYGDDMQLMRIGRTYLIALKRIESYDGVYYIPVNPYMPQIQMTESGGYLFTATDSEGYFSMMSENTLDVECPDSWKGYMDGFLKYRPDADRFERNLVICIEKYKAAAGK